jgi:GrpB-like predicted nucleotidyltransferase (UPF0157 family)
MLGLEYGSVRLVPSDPQWERAFEEERSRLTVALSNLPCEIEQIGSSSVPGMLAKPILDIAVGVPAGTPVELAISAIQTLGYEYRGDAGAEGGHVLVLECEPLVRTHHVHVVDLDGPQWEAYLLLREYLRRSEDARGAYSAEKQLLAARYANDHRAYTKAKDEIVTRLLEEARRSTGGCS